MKLFTKEILGKLNKTGYDNKRPIFKLFTPWGRATWLVTGMEDDILYGYADLGMNCIEWGGLFTMDEIQQLKGPFGLKVERDLHFTDDPNVNYFDLESLVGI